MVALLSKYPWEDATGFPLQIMMQATKKDLLDQRNNARRARFGHPHDRELVFHSSSRNDFMRLGEILIERNLISEEDLDRALELQRERGDKLGKILVDLGFIAMRDVVAALSEQLQVPVVAIDGPPAVSPETETLSPKFLRQFRCLPVAAARSHGDAGHGRSAGF